LINIHINILFLKRSQVISGSANVSKKLIIKYIVADLTIRVIIKLLIRFIRRSTSEFIILAISLINCDTESKHIAIIKNEL